MRSRSEVSWTADSPTISRANVLQIVCAVRARQPSNPRASIRAPSIPPQEFLRRPLAFLNPASTKTCSARARPAASTPARRRSVIVTVRSSTRLSSDSSSRAYGSIVPTVSPPPGFARGRSSRCRIHERARDATHFANFREQVRVQRGPANGRFPSGARGAEVSHRRRRPTGPGPGELRFWKREPAGELARDRGREQVGRVRATALRDRNNSRDHHIRLIAQATREPRGEFAAGDRPGQVVGRLPTVDRSRR